MKVIQGTIPLLISLPHVGTLIPPELRPAYVERAFDVEDTDWHLEALYAFGKDIGASLLVPSVSRYVIDLNRPPDDQPMYPGASNTELCPTRFFTGDPLYKSGCEPTADEKSNRLHHYWQPYHTMLQNELTRLRAVHGKVLLWEGHSIRSRLPWLFEGRLPDLNLGTASGNAAHDDILRAVANVCQTVCKANVQLSYAVNGRFKGGYITRQYGRPVAGIHALQLEMCQSLYMKEEAPWQLDDKKAATINPVLQEMVLAGLNALKAMP